MKKRILSLLLSMLLIIPSLTSICYAEADPQYFLSDKNVFIDDVFNMDVSIANNPGIISLRFSIEYDAETLQLLEMTDKGILRGYTTPSPNITSPYMLRWADSLATINNNSDGAVVSLKFKALSAGTTSVLIKHEEARNCSGGKIVFSNSTANVCIAARPISATGLSLSEASVTTETREGTYTLTPIFSPTNATNQNIIWQSSDDSIATVNGGVVTLQKKGEVTIKATSEDGGFEAICVINILCSHRMGDDIPAEESTCIKQGHGAYTICGECGEIISGSDSLLPYAEHNFIEKIQSKYLKTAATCICPAIYYKSCSICGVQSSETFAYGTASQDNHIGGTHLENQKIASCITEGYTGDIICDSCGKVVREGSTIEKTSHKHGVAAEENILPATCELTGGYDEVVYCSICHEEISREAKVIPANGHTSSEWIITNSATCSRLGTRIKKCTICGKTLETETIDTIPHTFIDTITDPTQTTQGYTTHKCSECGYSYVDSYTDYIPENPIVVFVESKEVHPGKEFTVSVNIQNNSGFSYLELTPICPDEFTLVSAVNGELISDFTKGKQYIWLSDEDVVSDGGLMTFTFKTSKDIEPGKYEVGFSIRSCINYDEDDVNAIVETGIIEVLSFTYGDVNGDNLINGQDVVRLKKYLANYDYDTGTSTIEIFAGADANGDGTVNGQDVVRLKKYLANYDYDTGMSTIVLGPQN